MSNSAARHLKLIRYSEKATTFEKNLPLYLTLLGNVKKIVRFFSKFCGLLRIYNEL